VDVQKKTELNGEARSLECTDKGFQRAASPERISRFELASSRKDRFLERPYTLFFLPEPVTGEVEITV